MNGFRTTSRADGDLQGYLLGARNVEIHGPARLGDTPVIRALKTTRHGDFGIIEGRVSRGDELLAQGEIKVWHRAETRTR